MDGLGQLKGSEASGTLLTHIGQETLGGEGGGGGARRKVREVRTEGRRVSEEGGAGQGEGKALCNRHAADARWAGNPYRGGGGGTGEEGEGKGARGCKIGCAWMHIMTTTLELSAVCWW